MYFKKLVAAITVAAALTTGVPAAHALTIDGEHVGASRAWRNGAGEICIIPATTTQAVYDDYTARTHRHMAALKRLAPELSTPFEQVELSRQLYNMHVEMQNVLGCPKHARQDLDTRLDDILSRYPGDPVVRSEVAAVRAAVGDDDAESSSVESWAGPVAVIVLAMVLAVSRFMPLPPRV